MIASSARVLLVVSAAAIGTSIASVSSAADEPSAGVPAPAARKPNIILIVADDLGYASLGCQGQKDIPTPAIDSLAANGVRFTSGYVTCPVCSPTRAGLLTGRYQQRFGHEFNPGGGADARQFGLPLSEKTLADRLKALGYTTGLVGKWHLGNDSEHRPQKRGFDEFFGFLGGAHSYLDPTVASVNAVRRGDEPVAEKEYLTDALSREAVAFVDRHREEPFFLYLTYNAVHTPMQAAPRHAGKFGDIADPKRRVLASMLTAMDEGIGKLLETVRSSGMDERTLVFFISDNGGPTPSNGSRNDPLRGFKGQVWEGGIRVPFLLQWKGKVPGGKVYDAAVISLDIARTAIAAAGGTAEPSLDGADLLPYLTGASTGAPHERLYWRFGQQHAVREGKWKLVQTPNAPLQLFDLAADPSESRNLADSKEDVVDKLRAAWEGWNAQLAKPLWGQGSGAKQAAAKPKVRAKAKAKARAKARADAGGKPSAE